VDHDEVLVFQPVPLFVLIARFISEDHMFAAYGEAIGDGVGDPEDLSPRDDAQTVRLESAILSRTDGILAIRELISVEWFDYDRGPCCVDLCLATTPEGSLLVLHDMDEQPSFVAIALGQELPEAVAQHPELILPRLATRPAVLGEVVVRAAVPWSAEELAQIVLALTGVQPTENGVLREDLLCARSS